MVRCVCFQQKAFMEDNKRRTAEEGNTLTRELFVEGNPQTPGTERLLDIEEEDEEEETPPGDE